MHPTFINHGVHINSAINFVGRLDDILVPYLCKGLPV